MTSNTIQEIQDIIYANMVFFSTGLVFIAFGFGLVDAGAILGLPLKSYSLWRKTESDGKEKPKPLKHSLTSPGNLDAKVLP